MNVVSQKIYKFDEVHSGQEGRILAGQGSGVRTFLFSPPTTGVACKIFYRSVEKESTEVVNSHSVPVCGGLVFKSHAEKL